jgi:hypothetical protein
MNNQKLLHEILAVENDKENASKIILDEAVVTFTKKQDHFIGRLSTYQPFDESALDADESSKELDTTVYEKLDYAFISVVNSIDVTATKESANQLASSDVVLDGEVFFTALPATTLLTLETRLKRLFEVFKHIPTLAPGRKWERDGNKGKHIWVDSEPEAKFRTQRTTKHKILVEATEHHPAQVDKWQEDDRIGKYITTTWSGMIHPAQKSELLSRTNKLIAAVKEARQRANTQPIENVSIGSAIKKYLLESVD